jgi:hypothetical protein
MAHPAIEDPESVANITPPATVRRLNRPGILPIHFSKVSIIRWAIPKRNITSPINRKRGTGSSEKEVIDLEILRMSWVSPTSPPQKRVAKSMLTKRKEKATGTPKKKRAINEKRMMINKLTQSIS